MKAKPIVILITLSFVASIVVVVLYAMSDKIVHEPNSFLRIYPPKIATLGKALDIKYNSYYIAGATNSDIYLGNDMNPLHLLIVNKNLTDTTQVLLKVKNRKKYPLTKYLRLKVDSPYFYLADGLMPGILRGRVDEWLAEPFMYDSAYFSLAEPIGPTSFAIRVKSKITREHVLAKIGNDTPHIKIRDNLLQKQIDGIFCTDGVLNYSKELNRVVYNYYYRNEYIVCDSNLNLDYRGHTIDTFSRANIKVATISSENKQVLASRPTVNNRLSCVSGHYLFINSNLLAKNDDIVKDPFGEVSIIDVYDLQQKKYKLSFLIKNHKGDNGIKRISNFAVLNNKKLISIHDHYLAIHDLQLEFKNKTPDKIH